MRASIFPKRRLGYVAVTLQWFGSLQYFQPINYLAIRVMGASYSRRGRLTQPSKLSR